MLMLKEAHSPVVGLPHSVQWQDTAATEVAASTRSTTAQRGCRQLAWCLADENAADGWTASTQSCSVEVTLVP